MYCKSFNYKWDHRTCYVPSNRNHEMQTWDYEGKGAPKCFMILVGWNVVSHDLLNGMFYDHMISFEWNV
jgi:hypothetical protein